MNSHQILSKTSQLISRRDLLLGGAGAVAFAASTALAQEGSHKHEGSHHEGSHSKSKNGHKHQKLMQVASDCAQKCQLCLSHCIEAFKVGDTSMADCAAAVQQTAPLCTLIVQFAALESDYLSDLRNICAQACLKCEEECRKHEGKHAPCKACAESCKKCANECRI